MSKHQFAVLSTKRKKKPKVFHLYLRTARRTHPLMKSAQIQIYLANNLIELLALRFFFQVRHISNLWALLSVDATQRIVRKQLKLRSVRNPFRFIYSEQLTVSLACFTVTAEGQSK